MPLGDSITWGMGGGSGGYRYPLFETAHGDGKDITFVGRIQNSDDPNSLPDGTPFPKDQVGHSGWTIDQLRNATTDPWNGQSFPPATTTIQETQPHIILLHIGTNDMNGSAAGADGRLSSFIDEIVAVSPDALLVVAQIIPFSGSETSFNSAIPGIVAEKANGGGHVVLVDMHSNYPPNSLADGIHPNAAGYDFMASVWYEAIKDYLPAL